jgi:Protein of unknown function with PCYCGC motif
MLRTGYVIALLGLIVFVLPGCGGASAPANPASPAPLTLAPESVLPDFVRSAPPQVREAYRFAVANPDVLKQYPCYCGCVAAGHQSNLDCYVKEQKSDGTVVFDDHAFG